MSEHKDETQVLLLLDLATDNPVTEAMVEPHMPPANTRHILRLSRFGALVSTRGSSFRERRPWMIAVNRMLDEARRLSEGADPLHYYVAGRATLPIFTYVGLRLSMHARVTCVNRRDQTHEWDVVPLNGSLVSEGAPRFFNHIRGLDEGTASGCRGKVAVFVSTGNGCSDTQMEAFIRAQGYDTAGIVELRAASSSGDPLDSIRWLGADNGTQASHELRRAFVKINSLYPEHEGLVLFVAGPGSLALMAGHAVNPHIHAPIWVPAYYRRVYEPAVAMPWGQGRTLRVLVVSANPRNEDWLNIRGEIREIQNEIRRAGASHAIALQVEQDVSVDDLWQAMMDHRPQVLHISGHGWEGGTVLVGDGGLAHPVPAGPFRELLRTTNDSFLDVVIMNSCSSAAQAEALIELVDCAIGMSREIPDDLAKAFSRVFYRAVASGRSVHEAFAQARAVIEARDVAAAGLVQIFIREGVHPDDLTLVDPATSRA